MAVYCLLLPTSNPTSPATTVHSPQSTVFFYPLVVWFRKSDNKSADWSDTPAETELSEKHCRPDCRKYFESRQRQKYLFVFLLFSVFLVPSTKRGRQQAEKPSCVCLFRKEGARKEREARRTRHISCALTGGWVSGIAKQLSPRKQKQKL